SPDFIARRPPCLWISVGDGCWSRTRTWNLDEYMKALNIDFATRKVAMRLSPAKVFFQEGDRFVIETFSAFRNYEGDTLMCRQGGLPAGGLARAGGHVMLAG
uniref:Uncharacterized protein n=1 Tax=Electrophorus electricus TaxID=8005 RepID=A0AAY5F5S2_ELEEL